MWRVLSEYGRLREVLIQDSVESFWTRRLPFEGIEDSLLNQPRCMHAAVDPGHGEWQQLPKMLRKEKVRVHEVTEILEEGLEKATAAERREIVEEVWEGFKAKPGPEELTVEHLVYGYPASPAYDAKTDSFTLPDFRRVSWPYARDTSFTTPAGTVICNMRRYSRRHEPRVVRLAYALDPVLREQAEVFWDASREPEGVATEPPCIEGGDTQVVDPETVAVGVGQRSTMTGFRRLVEEVARSDSEGRVTRVVAVQLPDHPAVDYMHLDTLINYPAEGRALAVPYIWETERVRGAPPRKMLLRLLEAVRAQSEEHGRPMQQVVHPDAFKNTGRCAVYRITDGKPRLEKTEGCYLDWLVQEGKLEPDGVVWVGGSENPKDPNHLMAALAEQASGAPNVVAVRQGVLIAYKRNRLTNEELRSNGFRVLEWEDSHLDLLGGPHCSTSPLSRDAS